MAKSRYYFLCMVGYAALTGYVLAAAFAPKFIPGIEFVALVPFFSLALAPIRNKQLFFLGWVAGTTAFTLYLWWFFDFLPLNWAGIETNIFVIGAAALTLFLAAGYFGLWFGVFLLSIKKYALKNAFRFSLATLLLWPTLEYARTALFSFHPYIQGSGWLWGPHAAFMLLGYTLAPYPVLRSLASILGTYGLSIAALIPNIVIFLVVAGYKKDMRAPDERGPILYHSLYNVLAGLVGLFLIFLFLGFFLSHHPPQKSATIKVGLVQTAFKIHDLETDEAALKRRREEKGHALQNLALQALKGDPDIVVVPEGSVSIFTERDFEAYPSFEEIVTTLGKEPYRVMVDTGFPSRKWSPDKNNTTVFDNRTGVVGTYQKQFLMPWGEYVPYFTAWVSRLWGFSWNDVIWASTPGNKPGVFETRLGKIGLLTCSEILSPKLTNETAVSGATVLIFSSSGAALHDSRQVQEQDLAMAQIHAATTRKPLVYGANESSSFALDALGNIVWESDGIKNESVVVSLETNAEKTAGMYLP